MSPVTPAEDVRTIMLNRISWGAVLAGVVAALVTQLILNMLGVGIGVATLDPVGGDNPQASTFSIAAGIWWTLSGIIASFVGGYIAGRLSGRPKESTAGLHGITAWAATTLVIFYLLTSTLGGLLGGVYNTVSGAIGGLGRTAATAAQTAAPSLANAADPFGAIEQQIRGATGNDPGAARDAAVTAVRAALTGDPGQAQAARDQAAEALARSQNIPVEEARNRIGQYEQQYRQTVDQAKQQATQAADTARQAVSTAALLGGIGLILGALAAFFGGRAGAVDPTITSARLATERGVTSRVDDRR
jgi:ElaB/YqjD/DUF883 family membrane-anchored ribosome-binding protein